MSFILLRFQLEIREFDAVEPLAFDAFSPLFFIENGNYFDERETQQKIESTQLIAHATIFIITDNNNNQIIHCAIMQFPFMYKINVILSINKTKARHINYV